MLFCSLGAVSWIPFWRVWQTILRDEIERWVWVNHASQLHNWGIQLAEVMNELENALSTLFLTLLGGAVLAWSLLIVSIIMDSDLGIAAAFGVDLLIGLQFALQAAKVKFSKGMKRLISKGSWTGYFTLMLARNCGHGFFCGSLDYMAESILDGEVRYLAVLMSWFLNDAANPLAALSLACLMMRAGTSEIRMCCCVCWREKKPPTGKHRGKGNGEDEHHGTKGEHGKNGTREKNETRDPKQPQDSSRNKPLSGPTLGTVALGSNVPPSPSPGELSDVVPASMEGYVVQSVFSMTSVCGCSDKLPPQGHTECTVKEPSDALYLTVNESWGCLSYYLHADNEANGAKEVERWMSATAKYCHDGREVYAWNGLNGAALMSVRNAAKRIRTKLAGTPSKQGTWQSDWQKP